MFVPAKNCTFLSLSYALYGDFSMMMQVLNTSIFWRAFTSPEEGIGGVWCSLISEY